MVDDVRLGLCKYVAGYVDGEDDCVWSKCLRLDMDGNENGNGKWVVGRQPGLL